MATVVEPAIHQEGLRTLSLEEYHWLIEQRFFHEDERVELIEGVLHRMSPKGTRHAVCLSNFLRILPAAIGERAWIRAQDPITLPDSGSEPEPDLVLAAPREGGYLESHPLPADVLLVVEIAQSSLEYDRQAKIPLYAAAAITEYWIVNLRDDLIEVFRGPTSAAEVTPYYRQHLCFSMQETVRPEQLADCALLVADLIPARRD